MNLTLDLAHKSDNLLPMGKNHLGKEARSVSPSEDAPNGGALLAALTEWQANNPPLEDDGAWNEYFESKQDPNESAF